MRLELKNIGKLSHADIELQGITVIAGENNSGKSTVGKVLYSMFNSFYNFEQEIQNTRIGLVSQELSIMLRENYSARYDFDFRRISRELSSYKNTPMDRKFLKNLLENNCNNIGIGSFDFKTEEKSTEISENVLTLAIDIWNKYMSIDDEKIYTSIFNKRIREEFDSQINNIYSTEEKGVISLKIKEEKVEMHIEKNIVSEISKTLSLDTEILYIDDPFVLDNVYLYTFNRLPFRVSSSHKRHLLRKLLDDRKTTEVEEAFNEIIINDRINKILNKINEVCGGSLRYTSKGFLYKVSALEQPINIINISTGLKTFIIIKELLLKGSLKENGTIILDEPEIHLHPEWQLLFAEIIVLLHKEFGMHILINTHSPYFLEAIEVYANKHGVDRNCKYYLAENEGNVSEIFDVTDQLERIYDKLARPLQELENERYSDECN